MVVSLVGIFFLVGRKLMSLRFLSADQQKIRMSGLPLFFDFVREDVIGPFEEFTAVVVQPATLKICEKFLRRFRLLVLKIETILHRLSDYFHGKRLAIKNGNGNGNGGGSPFDKAQGKNSDFWNEMREVKNGSQNSAESKKENKDESNN